MPLQSRLYLPEPVNLNHPLARGLVAWWLAAPSLSGGSTWFDIVGSNNGTLTNMTTSGSGWQGTTRPGGFGAMAIDGVNDYINVPSSAALGPTAALTVSAWVNSTNYGSFVPIITKSNTGTGVNNYEFRVLSGKIQLAGNNGQFTGGSTSLSTTAWQHVVGTYDGTTTRVFLNGILDGSGTTASFSANTTNTQIGARDSGPSSQAFSVDDVRLYSRALSIAEVRWLYDNSRLGYPGLLNQTKVACFFMRSTYNEVMSGGVFGGTSATVQISYGPTIASGGVLAADSAAYGQDFSVINGVGGADASGSGIYASTFNWSATGAALAAGSSPVASTFNWSATGGVLASGSSSIAATYNDAIVSAGVSVNGSALDGETDNIAASGGLSASGNAAIGAAYEIDPLASVGCFGAGVASSTSNFNPILTQTGVLTTGAVTHTEDYSPVIVAAGSLVGGSAAIAIQPLASGGAVLNGVSLIACQYNEVASGGLLCNGHADRIYNFMASGGAVVGDSADAGIQYSLGTAGGLLAADVEAGVVYKPGFRVYTKFKVGDLVFVPTEFSGRYLQYKVLAISTINTQAIYEVGVGWFQEAELLSYDEYRAWRCKNAEFITRFMRCPVR